MRLRYCLWGVLSPLVTSTSVWAGAIHSATLPDSVQVNPQRDETAAPNLLSQKIVAKIEETARTNAIFTPHLDRIRQSLPAQWVMRLPAQMSLNQVPQSTLNASQVEVVQSTAPPKVIVNLVTCQTGSADCLLASFSAESSTSAIAQQALKQHQLAASPITLVSGIQGYLWEGWRHQQPRSSVMWVQDGMIYTVSFPTQERQNLLYAAVYMANAQPISALATPTALSPDAASIPLVGALPLGPQSDQPPASEGSAAPPANVDRPGAAEEPSVLQAQNSPTQADRDRFLQPPPAPLPNERPVLPLEPPAGVKPPVTEPDKDQSAIQVRQIKVTESRVLSPQDIVKITDPLKGRKVTFQQLNEATDQITKIYLDRGYITSRAILESQSDQDKKDGVVRISILEGELEDIKVEGTQRLDPNYIRNRVARGVTVPLNARKLEDQLRLLLIDPLFTNVVPTLEAGKEEGKSILTVRVTEAPPFSGNVSFDNLSPPSVGSERAGVTLRYRNLTGIGDELSGAYYRSLTGGSSIASFTYRAPLNPMEGSLQIRADINRNRITQAPFDDLDIKGASEQYELSYRQPLWRSPREEFALSLGFAFQDGQTFIFNDLPQPFGIGPDRDGVSRTSVIKFGQDYVSRDEQGAWSLRSQFSLGTGLFKATANPDPIPDGQFISWLGQIQRVQRLSDGQLLIAQLDLQLTPDNLLPSQQFVIGGGQSVRGYRQNARTGDNGVRVSVEDRITLQRDKVGKPTLQVAPFIDLGAVWNGADNPNPLPRQTFLMGAGVGVVWKPFTGLNLRLDYGFPIIDLSDRGSNLQDDGLYFMVDYQF
jgi:hemolysin activation/secretion protein